MKDTWYFMVFTYDSSLDNGTAKAYLDGNREAAVTSVGIPNTDNNGNLNWSNDPKNQVLVYKYDLLNRLVVKQYRNDEERLRFILHKSDNRQ